MENHKKLKNGSYSVLLCVLAAAALVIINLIVRAMPVSVTQADISKDKLYSLSETTKDAISALDRDITIYLIASEGNEDDMLVKLLDRYQDLSSHIKVETVDPVKRPGFVSQYTSDSLNENSVILVSGEQSKIIGHSDFYEYQMTQSYSYQMTGFDGEGQLTSAIAYLVNDERSKIYVLEGHSETELSGTMTDQISKNNMDTETLNLIKTADIPEDASAILINSPQKDLTSAEVEHLTEYVNNGGHLFLIPSYMSDEHPNLDTLLGLYGVKLTDGIIVEGDSSMYYPNYPTYLFPSISSSDITSDLINQNSMVLLPVSQGIEFTESSELTYNTLLTTSAQSYSKVNVSSQTIAKEDGDIDGPFDVAASVEKTVGDKTSKLFICTSAGFTDSTVNEVVAGGNAQLFTKAVIWMTGQESNAAVPVKSLTDTALTLTSSQLNLWVSIVVAVIPAVILIAGIIVCVRRRRKR